MWTFIILLAFLIVNMSIGFGYLSYYFITHKNETAQTFTPTRHEVCFIVYCFWPFIVPFILFEILQRLLGRKQ